MMNRKAAAASFGNVLEWYDFAVFGALTDVLGDKFFPGSNSTVKFLEAFGVFGAAFLMRPVGGLFYGWVGDKFGRRRALELSILLMLICSLIMGCLPTYGQIGVTATVILVALRLIQGMAVGGELVSAYIFMVENAQKGTQVFWGAMCLNSANTGTLSGLLVATIVRAVCTQDQLEAYGWRICFVFGIFFGLAGYYLRTTLDHDDTPEFEAARRTGAVGTAATVEAGGNTYSTAGRFVCNVLNTYVFEIMVTVGVAQIWCSGFYTSFVWMSYYYDGLPDDRYEKIEGGWALNTAMLGLLVLLMVPAGFIGNKQGAQRMVAVGCVISIVGALPAFALISTRTIGGAVAGQLILALAFATVGAGLPAFMVNQFPVHVRAVTMGASYNIAQAIFGGPSPIVCTALAIEQPLLPAVWLIFSALVCLGSLPMANRLAQRRAEVMAGVIQNSYFSDAFDPSVTNPVQSTLAATDSHSRGILTTSSCRSNSAASNPASLTAQPSLLQPEL